MHLSKENNLCDKKKHGLQPTNRDERVLKKPPECDGAIGDITVRLGTTFNFLGVSGAKCCTIGRNKRILQKDQRFLLQIFIAG